MNKKESILQSALELLVVNGIHATPMSAIAKAAKTGMGTIYNYFANKEILINAIYVDIKQKEEVLLTSLEIDVPIKTLFEAYYLSVVQFYTKNPAYFKFMEQLQGSPMITDESRKVGYQAIDVVINMLKAGQKERIIKTIDTHELLHFLGGNILSFVRWFSTNSHINKNEAIQNQLRMVWDAIKE